MSNIVNDSILERIAEDVEAMSTGAILIELLGGSKPGLCDSFDERVAFTDRDKVIADLIEKRFEEECR
tara:strand:+ start:769 stop:972 length:204 start_codon:yes stop_codon:yes gene_type:complete